MQGVSEGVERRTSGRESRRKSRRKSRGKGGRPAEMAGGLIKEGVAPETVKKCSQLCEEKWEEVMKSLG